jgi:hypothetical protein
MTSNDKPKAKPKAEVVDNFAPYKSLVLSLSIGSAIERTDVTPEGIEHLAIIIYNRRTSRLYSDRRYLLTTITTFSRVIGNRDSSHRSQKVVLRRLNDFGTIYHD